MHPARLHQLEQQHWAPRWRLWALPIGLIGGKPGGDDAHVHVHRHVAAHAVELPVGQHAQQARLQIRRHLADFVQEQRAAVGLLEAPGPLRGGAGKGPALVAEELALHQILRDRGRVDGDEGLLRPRAVRVQRPRHQLLAGAGLAGDQHRDLRLGQAADGAKHLLHGRRLADDLRRGDRLGRRGGPVPARQLGPLHQLHRLVDVERLGQVFEGAALVGGHGGIQVRMRRHDDDRHVRVHGVHARQQFQAVDALHADVGHHHVGAGLLQGIQHLDRTGEGLHGHAAGLQGALQHPAYRFVVVDDPDLHRHSGSLLRGRYSAKTVSPGRLSHSISPP